jgi:hypothetical protein
MPFKTVPDTIAQIEYVVSNLPRRLTGRPPLTKGPHDPEICGSFYEGYISTAFNYVADHNTDILILGGECQKLATCLAGKTVSSLYITCANCTGGKTSSSSAGSIQLCLSAFGLALTQNTVNGLVFRELIRMCGGMELDAWGLDSYFSYVDPGPPPHFLGPVPAVVKGFMCAGSTPGTGNWAGYRLGNFVVWQPITGLLWARYKLPGQGPVGPSIISTQTTDWQDATCH